MCGFCYFVPPGWLYCLTVPVSVAERETVHEDRAEVAVRKEWYVDAGKRTLRPARLGALETQNFTRFYPKLLLGARCLTERRCANEPFGVLVACDACGCV